MTRSGSPPGPPTTTSRSPWNVVPGGPHVFQAFAAILDEGQAALTRAGDFLRGHTGTATAGTAGREAECAGPTRHKRHKRKINNSEESTHHEQYQHHRFGTNGPNRPSHAQPIYYLNNPMTFVPSGKAVEFPSYTQALDYELQLASSSANRSTTARPMRVRRRSPRSPSPRTPFSRTGATCGERSPSTARPWSDRTPPLPVQARRHAGPCLRQRATRAR